MSWELAELAGTGPDNRGHQGLCEGTGSGPRFAPITLACLLERGWVDSRGLGHQPYSYWLLEGGRVGSGWRRREAGSALMPLRALSKGDLGQLPQRPGTGWGAKGPDHSQLHRVTGSLQGD